MIKSAKMGYKRVVAAICFQLDTFRRRPGYLVVLVVLCLLYVIYWLAMKGSNLDAVANKHSVVKTNLTVKTGPQGLTMAGNGFTLSGKPFTILSGTIHYFRVVPEYWEDRLMKLKAMGLNTVETYIAWNVHEEIRGYFVFRDAYDIVKFVQMAKNLGLYVIIRPGPYICAEWEFGGLPSWLLKDPNQKLRSSYPPYLEAVEKYFEELFPLLTPLQYSKGGPIIAWQIENEYLSWKEGNDHQYMQALQQMMIKQGVTELFFTSDNVYSIQTHSLVLEGVLQTINFQRDPKTNLDLLKTMQPDKPLMVTEFWPGWFDVWGQPHHVMNKKKVTERVAEILAMGASINFYMFHGGTNFGFMNGALVKDSDYMPDVTSYDYDAPITEAGDITPKYKALRATIRQHAPHHSLPRPFPEIPPSTAKTAYDDISVDGYAPLKKFLKHVDQAFTTNKIMPMELLPINNKGGQGYGFIVYQTKLSHDAKSLVIEDYRDRVKILVNSKLVSTLCAYDSEKKVFDFKKMERNEIELQFQKPTDQDDDVILDILVENLGRVNSYSSEFAVMDNQRKGILGKVMVDGQTPRKWRIFPLDFNKLVAGQAFTEMLWPKVPKVLRLSNNKTRHAPSFYKATLNVQGYPRDTFVNLQGWGKGVCFVNGRNIGRYWEIGPQYTLYLPGVWLNIGENTIILFELEKPRPDMKIEFSDEPIIKGEAMERQ